VEELKKAGVSYKEIAKGLKRSVRMVRYWRKPIYIEFIKIYLN
jgi:DNA-binding CsgD family transcriptional regulator